MNPALADMTARRDRLADKVGELALSLAQAGERERRLAAALAERDTEITTLRAAFDEAREALAEERRLAVVRKDYHAVDRLDAALTAALQPGEGSV